MARPFDDDSGVLASRELSPPFSSYDQPADPSPFWAPTGRSVTAPMSAQPPAWSPYGTWSSNGKTVPPRSLTVGMGIKRRPRWVLRFFLFFVLVGAGAVLFRKQLPPFPRSIADAERLWDQGKALIKGQPAPAPAAPAKPLQAAVAPAPAPAPVAAKPAAPATAAVRARGPEIVPIPALPSQAARPVPARVGRGARREAVAAMPARPRRRGLLARVRTPSARAAGPSALAAVPFNKPAAQPAGDPFEDGGAAKPAAAKPAAPKPAEEAKPEKPVSLAAVASADEASEPAAPPAPKPARRAAAEPAPKAAAPDSLDALMATAVSHPTRRSPKNEVDRKLASADEEAPAPRKKVDAPPAHALTRSEIQSVMAGVQAKVSDCYRKFQVPGAADVKIAVGEDGSVTTVSVTGPVAGTPSGACVERAVSNATFPPSSGLRFDYRLQLR
jgi:hypothetical protein